jgi:hypothetical protein
LLNVRIVPTTYIYLRRRPLSCRRLPPCRRHLIQRRSQALTLYHSAALSHCFSGSLLDISEPQSNFLRFRIIKKALSPQILYFMWSLFLFDYSQSRSLSADARGFYTQANLNLRTELNLMPEFANLELGALQVI